MCTLLYLLIKINQTKTKFKNKNCNQLSYTTFDDNMLYLIGLCFCILYTTNMICSVNIDFIMLKTDGWSVNTNVNNVLLFIFYCSNMSCISCMQIIILKWQLKHIEHLKTDLYCTVTQRWVKIKYVFILWL